MRVDPVTTGSGAGANARERWSAKGGGVWGRRTAARRLPFILVGIVALAACEAPELDLPAPAADRIEDGASIVPEDLLPRDGQPVERIAVGPGGEVVYGALGSPGADGTDTRLVRWVWDGERWAGPEDLHFTVPGDGEISVAPDGSYLLFSSARETGQIGAGDRNLWLAQREEDSELGSGPEGAGVWTDPWMVPVIHSPDRDGSPALAMTGRLFYASERDRDTSGGDLYVSTLDGGMWTSPQSLDRLNSPGNEADPWVAPDGSFLLFASDRGGQWDLYVAFSEDGGETWADPDILQPPVVTDADERAPALSPAGEVIFFVRGDGELWWAHSREAGAQRPTPDA